MNSIEHDLEPGHLTNCQVCGSTGLELVIDLGHQSPCDSLLKPHHLNESENTYPLRFLRCPHCGLAQIDYVVPSEVLFFPDYPYRSGITGTLVNNLRSTGIKAIDQFGLKPGSFVVDIGSNDGTLLTSFKEKGMRVLGVEPTNIAHIAIASGIPTKQCFFTQEVVGEIVAEHGRASVVTAANMFAHVAALGSLIRGVEQLLDKDGVFISESHYLLDLLETVQYDSIYHEHLKYYSLKSLIKLFSYYDFTVIDVDRIPNYGGSIRVYAAKGRDRPVTKAVVDLLEEEQRYGLDQAAPFELFAKRIRQARFQLQELVVGAAGRGQTVVGIGCPGRSSTLLNYSGIDPELMPYIAEQSTSLKLGMFLPGKHIPIVDEERLFREQPDYAVMLSWHYWEPIVAKLRAKGLRSKLVLPLPEVRVLE